MGIILTTSQGARGDAKIRQFDGAILGGEDVCAFDVAMDDTLVVEVIQAVEDLGHVYPDQVLGELAVGLADGMERAIFAISGRILR